MFYLVQELLESEGVQYSTHKGLISEFGKRFVKQGRIDGKYGRILNKGYEMRMFGDYGQKDIVTSDLALSVLRDTLFFNNGVKDLFPEE